MKSKLRYFSIGLLAILFASMGITACAPPDSNLSDSMIDPPDVAIASQVAWPVASPFASQIATLMIDPNLLRRWFGWVDPGWFPLGADLGDDLARGDELPQTDTHQPGFWMSQGEVTNKEYAQCVETGICSVPSLRPTGPTNHYGDLAYDDHPVVGVDWFQAEGYCEWIMARLPTEAEWEKAAGGAMGYVYPWGDESPSCDRANGQIEGCPSEGDTKPVGSFPLGTSPYGFFDMAGNVREWMQDWYAPDAYLTAAEYAPTGPVEGEKRVVRGGGFNDFKENLRTTARWAYEPEKDFDDVGFRCVPVTPSYATFCEPSYVPLCYDPDIPRDDEPCEPEQNIPSDEDVSLLGFGCPLNRIVCFEVDTNGGGTSGYSASVDEDNFACEALDDRPDIIQCCGPEQPMGRNVQITICAPGGSPGGTPVSTTAMEVTDGIKMASIAASGVVTLMRTTAPNCPDGYTYDPETGECLFDQTQPICTDGWKYDRMLNECVPKDPEEDCLPTTTFNPSLEGCTPDDGECPEGYFLTDRRTCEPDENNNGNCPPGYYFNTDINCCEPIPPDNFGCPDGYYWHTKYERCVMIDDYNCGFGMTYNGYGECDQNPYTPGPNDPPQGECPPGMVAAAGNMCDPDSAGGTPANPLPGTGLRTGDLQLPGGLIVSALGPTAPECPDGYYYHERYERCVERDPNDCPRGYFYDTGLEKCVPTNGPNSPCPIGFVYNPRTECCTPEPGMDSTRCPGDPETPIGTPDLSQGFTPFQTSGFNPESGECEKVGQNGDGVPCPPATFVTALGNCDQYPPDNTVGTPDLAQLSLMQANCPEEYWDEEAQDCHPPDPCLENEYFDRQLGYCVPLQDDCCPIGQDYSPEYEECVDVVTKPRDGECPNGFELIDGLCWLIGRTEGRGGKCWTITRNTPQCIGPCEVGKIYNETTGKCEEPVDPCADVNCSAYTSRGTCPTNCCRWEETQTGYGKCVSK